MPLLVYRKIRGGQQLGVSFIVCLSSLHAFEAHAQSLGTWNIANFRYSFSERIGVFGEGQIRSWGFYDDFYYYEYKGGISYALLPKFTVTLACGRYVTFAGQGNFALPKSNDEFRLWVQALTPSVWQHWVWEHRLRAEARFTSAGSATDFVTGYRQNCL